MPITPYTPVMLDVVDGSGSDSDEHLFANVRSPVHVPGSDEFYFNFNLLDTDVTQADTQADTYSGEILRNIINEKITEGGSHDWKFVKGFKIMEDQSYSYSRTDKEILIFKGVHDILLDKAYEMYMLMSYENKDLLSKNEDLQGENEDLQREKKDLQREKMIVSRHNASLLERIDHEAVNMRTCDGGGGMAAFHARVWGFIK
jgi:hypothetical protein